MRRYPKGHPMNPQVGSIYPMEAVSHSGLWPFSAIAELESRVGPIPGNPRRPGPEVTEAMERVA